MDATSPSMGGREIQRMRRRVQMIFQDPYSSLNPRMTVHDTLYEALDVHHLYAGRNKREAAGSRSF